MGDRGAGVDGGLMAELDRMQCSDEERALVLVLALITRARRSRARAGALMRPAGVGRVAGLRRAAGAALALAEAEEAMGVATQAVRALGGA